MDELLGVGSSTGCGSDKIRVQANFKEHFIEIEIIDRNFVSPNPEMEKLMELLIMLAENFKYPTEIEEVFRSVIKCINEESDYITSGIEIITVSISKRIYDYRFGMSNNNRELLEKIEISYGNLVAAQYQRNDKIIIFGADGGWIYEDINKKVEKTKQHVALTIPINQDQINLIEQTTEYSSACEDVLRVRTLINNASVE